MAISTNPNVPRTGILKAVAHGQINGGGGVDNFRIKIWDKASGGVISDNKRGATDDIDSANPQALGGGSIVIHKDTADLVRVFREGASTDP